MQKMQSRACLALLILSTISLKGRSIHRKADPLTPEIIVTWTGDPAAKKYHLKSYFLQEWSIFGRYDAALLEQSRPPKEITYRYEPAKKVPLSILSELIEQFIQEIAATTRKKKTFKDFTILKDADFNYKTNSGLIVAKFKNYPFIIKLAIENPKSFTQPYSKGIVPSFLFVMGNGINRYLANFTRIPNLHSIQKKIEADPFWSQKLTTPRKWFWTPKNSKTFTVRGKNMGPAQLEAEYPSVYCILCDAIDIERPLSVAYREDRHLGMQLAQFLESRVDPHISNFVVERGTGKIALIDTEHFASIVGLREEFKFNHYTSWYAKLTRKCLTDAMLRNKKERRQAQKEPVPAILII